LQTRHGIIANLHFSSPSFENPNLIDKLEQWKVEMGECLEMRLRSTLFKLKFLGAEQPHVIMELKLPGSRKLQENKKPHKK